MGKLRVGKNIFPDLTEDLIKKVERLKENYGISIYFLFEDGIEFAYPENRYEVKRFPGDISFWEGINPIISYVENLGSIEFCLGYDDEPFLIIPTLQQFQGEELLEKLRNFITIKKEEEKEDA